MPSPRTWRHRLPSAAFGRPANRADQRQQQREPGDGPRPDHELPIPLIHGRGARTWDREHPDRVAGDVELARTLHLLQRSSGRRGVCLHHDKPDALPSQTAPDVLVLAPQHLCDAGGARILPRDRTAGDHEVVVRDGRPVPIDARELVVDDLVLLEAGDRVSADLRAIEVHALTIDTSTLTGESVPVVVDIDLDPVAAPDR